MIPHLVGVLYTIEVHGEHPSQGDLYRDFDGHLWTIRGEVRPARLVPFRHPEDEGEVWEADIAPNHPAYYLKPGEDLEPYDTTRHGPTWAGRIEHNRGVGFGSVGTLSWAYRKEGHVEWLRIGPRVTSFSSFDNPVYEQVLANDGTPLWARVQQALENYPAAPP